MLVTLSDAADTLPRAKYGDRAQFERFVDTLFAALQRATEIFFISRKPSDLGNRERLFKRIATGSEQVIPADFQYTFPEIGDNSKSIMVANILAEWSYRNGNPSIASARLAIAAERAKADADPEMLVSILASRYEGDQKAGAPVEQVRRLRD